MLEDLDAALARMRAAGVERAVTIGVDLASSEWAVRAAAEHSEVAATVGLHPHDAKDLSDGLLARLDELARDPRVVGVGEAGLDFHYDNSPRPDQRRAFAAQIGIAKAAGKALVIHCREAWEEIFEILEREGPPERLVFHCWSGGPESARRAVEMGAVLSFSGTVTFKNAPKLRTVAEEAPLARTVVETDAPFLTPMPHRGKRNEPAYVRLVAEKIAEVKGVPLEEAARATTENARRLFGL
jgi:TatD DNase family protein